MTAKDLGELESAGAVIPPGARVHVGFVDAGDLATRVSTARAIKRSRFMPVPVIAARRLRSGAMLQEYLDALQAAGASGSVLVVADDPTRHGSLTHGHMASACRCGLGARTGERAAADVIRVPVRCQSECASCPDYGLSLNDLAAMTAPGRFIRTLASGYDARVHGEMKLHFNPFGGFTATAEWISRRSAARGAGRQ